MSRPQTPFANRDVTRSFVHDAKNNPQVASTDSDPHATHRHTPDLESESDEETTGAPDVRSDIPIRIVSPGEQTLTALDRTVSRVRFRSRVRISAGIGRRRRRLSDGLSSNASSLSGSPSSSISAPLRTHHAKSNGWGPLGSRTSLLASQTAPLSPSQAECAGSGNGNANASENGDEYAQRPNMRSSQTHLDDDVDEHTHLMISATRHSYVGNRHLYDQWYPDGGERQQERWWREQLVDETFGKWPARLFNRHWWRWRLESVLCCFCDSDEEE